MNIKQLVIELENCETIYVSTNNVGTLELNDIKRGIFRYNSKYINNTYQSDELYIEILNPTSFKVSSLMYSENEERPSCLERILQYPDITSITIIYDDDKEESISVLWDYEDECNNSYQKAQVSKEGNLHILISERGLKEYLNKDREGYYDFIMNCKNNGFWE